MMRMLSSEGLDVRAVQPAAAVEDVPGSDKLLALKVNFGDHRRTILSGMKQERANPRELENYPAPTDGYVDHHGNFVKYDPTRKELPESLPRYKQVWGELARRAADKGVRIAFENCPMLGTWETGDWNIAHNPAAWEMMFNELPHDNIGLEWEPCHQLFYLIDPMPQLIDWMPKIFHVHGKDATVRWDVVRKHGIHGKVPFAFHRTPGFGDTNWTDVISELRLGGYQGSIDIEGWHDPVYRDELEMTGQVRALNYLKECRGGAFVANP